MDEQDSNYIAMLRPDLTLGTLAYVEQLEARAEKAEARVASLLAEFAAGIQPADIASCLKMHSEPAFAEFLRGANSVHATNLRWVRWKAAEFGLAWPLSEAFFEFGYTPDTPAPVSPSSQDPAGAPLSAGKLAAFGYEEPVPTYDEFIRLATANEPVWVPTLDTWDQLTDQGKRNMMQVAELKPRELKAQPYATAAPQGEETPREEVAGG